MNILVICDVLFPQTVGGAGRVAREVARALEKKGHSICFFTRRASNGLPEDEDKTIYYPPPGRALPGRHRTMFQQVVKDFAPDLLHVHQPLPAFLSIPSPLPAPFVYTFHSSWAEEFRMKSSLCPQPFRFLIGPLLSAVEKRVLARAHAVTLLSEFSRRRVESLYKGNPVMIPGGVETQRFQPLNTKTRKGDIRLIAVRNLVPRMGLSRLIRAVKLLPSNFRLEIGGRGPLKKELEHLAESLGLTNRVRLVGHVPEPELPRFYSEADLFVLPTVALEGFGLVILESLSCGTPVIGTRIGAIPEFLEKFDPDWVIPETTPEAIARTILAVTRKPSPPPQELHRRVAAEFDWDIIADRYLEVFDRVLEIWGH